MAYAAKIIADSVSLAGVRLTTFEITYPKFVHNELMTHRMFSRNTASSRAIPYSKTRQMVLDDPVMPVWWGLNQAGMQAKEEVPNDRKQMDYGNDHDPFSNLRDSKGFGVAPSIGALIRLNDKVSRLKSFATKGSLANESAEDSLRDIAVYSIITLVLLEEEAANDYAAVVSLFSEEHYRRLLTGLKATAEIVHPVYGDCDALGQNGACSACLEQFRIVTQSDSSGRKATQESIGGHGPGY